MKFKKDGTVFEDIFDVLRDYHCDCMCGECEIRLSRCNPKWMRMHPTEAARLMGYEVIEDETENMHETYTEVERRAKPLKDWTLGEVKEYCEKREIAEDYHPDDICSGCEFNVICDAYVESWDLTEKPRFTDKEIEQAKTLMSLLPYESSVQRFEDGYIAIRDHTGEIITRLKDETFPSIRAGERYKLNEIVGGEEEPAPCK